MVNQCTFLRRRAVYTAGDPKGDVSTSMNTASRMGSRIDDTTVPLVICEVCLKRVAKDMTRQAETPNYRAYFCSDQCWDRWHAQHGGESSAA